MLQQLVSLKLKDCNDVEDYVNKMMLLWSKVQRVGFKIGDDVIGSLMLGELPIECIGDVKLNLLCGVGRKKSIPR